MEFDEVACVGKSFVEVWGLGVSWRGRLAKGFRKF
jgi:hypothetical protein